MKIFQKLTVAAVVFGLVGFLLAKADSKKDGARLYMTKCAACHGKAGEGKDAMAKALKVSPEFLVMTDEGTQSLSDEQLNEIILKGQGKMKATKVTAEESQQIVQFVKSLGGATDKAKGTAKATQAKGKEAVAEGKKMAQKTKASFDPEKTAALYKSKCASCHGAKGEGNETMSKIFKAPTSLLESKNKPHEDLIQITADGKNKMPGYKSKLTAKEIEELIAYIETFAAN